MKTLKLIALAAFALLFSQCKSPTQAMQGPSSGAAEIPKILLPTEEHFLQFADQTNGNASEALMLTADWVRKQSNVASVDVLDSTYINIVLKSGLQTTFYLDEVDASGLNVFRGGGKPPQQSHQQIEDRSKNLIKNKNVMIYAAGYSQFYSPGEIEGVVALFANSKIPFNVTLLKDGECTPDMIDSFPNYGFVIMDTHGTPDAFLTGAIADIKDTLQDENAIKQVLFRNAGTDSYLKLLAGKLVLQRGIKVQRLQPRWYKDTSLHGSFWIWATSKYIDALPSMPNTMIFGNMCYSGNRVTLGPTGNKPIRNAFRDKNLFSYYGYAYSNGTSAPVGNAFAKIMEDTLVKALVADLDSTGDAHLNNSGANFFEPHANGKQLFFELTNSDDYSYDEGKDSITDERDGQKYAIVNIGNQTWMAQNLNYAAAGSHCNNGDAANCAIYGRLYDWNTFMQGTASSSANPSGVRGVCPRGWHVPSVAEFKSLTNFLGGDLLAGSAMRSTSPLWNDNFNTTNKSGFSVLPGGWNYIPQPGTSSGQDIGIDAGFWTSEETTISMNNDSAFELLLYGVTAGVTYGSNFKLNERSCRCLKD